MDDLVSLKECIHLYIYAQVIHPSQAAGEDLAFQTLPKIWLKLCGS